MLKFGKFGFFFKVETLLNLVCMFSLVLGFDLSLLELLSQIPNCSNVKSLEQILVDFLLPLVPAQELIVDVTSVRLPSVASPN